MKVYEDYEALINAEDIDAIYNPLPNGYHAYYTILALKAGKHVLCEKPLASNEAECKAMLEAYEEGKKINPYLLFLEAFHYRFHPLASKVREVVESKVIGDITHVEGIFHIPFIAFGKKDIRYNVHNTNSELAGGSLMDAGCYALSFIRLAVGDTAKVDVESTKTVRAFKNSNIVDSAADATLNITSSPYSTQSITAKLSSSFTSWGFTGSLKVVGTLGEIYVYNLIMPFVYHYMTVKTKQGTKTIKEYGKHGGTTYDFQLKCFADAIDGDEKAIKLASFAGSAENGTENMRIIDDMYKKAGMEVRQGKPLE